MSELPMEVTNNSYAVTGLYKLKRLNMFSGVVL